MAVVPTGYLNKATPVDNDSLWGYDSEGIANSNFLLSAIATYVLSVKTTTDLTEGTNLYYTDTRVGNSTYATTTDATILALDASKEDIANKSTTTTLGTSDTLYPTQNAVKTYVDTFGVPINGQTEITELANDDEFIVYDTSAGLNRKIQSQNISGANIGAGTTYTLGEANTLRSNVLGTFVKQKEIECRGGGTFTVAFTAESNIGGGSAADRSGEYQIFKNGVAFGTLQINSSEASSGIIYTEDLTFVYGDLIQLYSKKTGTVDGTKSANVLDFSVKYNITGLKYYTGTINLD